MVRSMQTVLDGDFGSMMRGFGFRKKGLDYRLGGPGQPQVMVAIQGQSLPGLPTTLLVDVGVFPQP